MKKETKKKNVAFLSKENNNKVFSYSNYFQIEWDKTIRLNSVQKGYRSDSEKWQNSLYTLFGE